MQIGQQFLISCAVYLLIAQQVIVDAFTVGSKKISKCYKCPPGWGVYKNCTADSDTICKMCENRQTYSSHYSSTSPCLLCSRCGVGLYESYTCSLTRDTVCSECISYIGQKQFVMKNDFAEKCSYLFKNHKIGNKFKVINDQL